MSLATDRPIEPSVIVEFCGELIEIPPGRTFTFGRAADLEIDDNPFLHRQIGLLEYRGGWWWLRNVGSRIPLSVKDRTSRSQVTLAPGRDLALTFASASVQFSAGRSNYEIVITVPVPPPLPIGPGDADGETISLSDVPLTVDQRRLILALAEATLLSGDAAVDLPTNRAAALRLGWTITRFNRKLDNVCDRLAKSGVSGLRGQAGLLATDRRVRLVEHAVSSGLVNAEELSLLRAIHD